MVPNNVQGIARLVRHLVNVCGRRSLVFIRGDMNQNDGVERDLAFRQEVMRHNLSVPDRFLLRGDFNPALASESLKRLLEHTRDFDGIVAADYLMALSAIEVLTEVGLRVPDDVSVVGFGDGSEAAEAGLTTVAADVEDLGRRSARQLIGQIEGLRIRGLTMLSTTLIQRHTCIPAVLRETLP